MGDQGLGSNTAEEEKRTSAQAHKGDSLALEVQGRERQTSRKCVLFSSHPPSSPATQHRGKTRECCLKPLTSLGLDKGSNLLPMRAESRTRRLTKESLSRRRLGLRQPSQVVGCLPGCSIP